jgi:hypothetical protein
MSRLRRGTQSEARILEVPLSSCVHYCGFRYGRSEYHPYESYQVDICRGVPVREARRRFIAFLRHYRPRHFEEALGITLSRPCALWVYPWNYTRPGELHTHGWHESPDDCPDILTHFSPFGIPSVRIEEEFVWLERILRSVGERGYQPGVFGPAHALELCSADLRTAYLLLDGNHRAGALTALGSGTSLLVRCDRSVREDDVQTWMGVRQEWMSRADALAIFQAYFTGNSTWSRSPVPAPILAPAGWRALYLDD